MCAAVGEIDDETMPIVRPRQAFGVAREDSSSLANGGEDTAKIVGTVGADKLCPLKTSNHQPETLVRARKLEQTMRCAVSSVVHGWLQARAQLQALEEGEEEPMKWAAAAASAEQLLARLPDGSAVHDQMS